MCFASSGNIKEFARYLCLLQKSKIRCFQCKTRKFFAFNAKNRKFFAFNAKKSEICCFQCKKIAKLFASNAKHRWFRHYSKYLSWKKYQKCRKVMKIHFYGIWEDRKETPKNTAIFHQWYAFKSIGISVVIWHISKKFTSTNLGFQEPPKEKNTLKFKASICCVENDFNAHLLQLLIDKIHLNYWYHSANGVFHFKLLLSFHINFKKRRIFKRFWLLFYFLVILVNSANIFKKILFSVVHRIQIIKYLCLNTIFVWILILSFIESWPAWVMIFVE